MMTAGATSRIQQQNRRSASQRRAGRLGAPSPRSGNSPGTDEGRIRVLHIITRLVRGGAQGVVLDLLRGLPAERFQPMLAAGSQTGREGSLWDEVEELDVPVVRVPTLVREISPWNDLRALRALQAIIRRERPHIVHAHTSKAGFLGCAAAHRERVRGVILAPHGHILGKNAEIPGVPGSGLRRWILGAMARWNARYAHAVISPNEVERQDGIRHHMWSEEKSIAVPNGIDTGRFLPSDRNSARRALGISREEQLVGVVARLTREKGVDLAIEALARVPGARLVIVGDGPELEALGLQARQSGVAERISFLGLRKSIETVLPAFDVLLIPSRTEAHGLVAAEASACQVPVVAARVGGLSSLVSHDESGLLFPSGDVEAMARLLKELLARRELGRRLGEAGRRHIVAHFSRKVMIERTVEVYEQLLGGVS